MRLRDSVKPPQRYSGDAWVPLALSSRVPRCARPASKPLFVDYNPSLPPAAFPTLDEPRPSGGNANRQNDAPNTGQLTRIESGDEMVWEGTRNRGNSVLEEEDGDGGEDALMHNLRVSNENNPFHNSDHVAPPPNANPPRSSPPRETEEDDGLDHEFIRSCEDNPEDYEVVPKWDDLSARLQVEIIHNLQKKGSWAEITSTLGLTRKEEKEVLEHCQHRNVQLEAEKRVIREMHHEQLKDILRADNLDPRKQRSFDQLALRRLSRRYMADLMQRVSPDYLMCETWELSSAKKFLRNIGLNPALAGEWADDVMTPQEKSFEKEKSTQWRETPRGKGVRSTRAGGPSQDGTETDEQIIAQRGDLESKINFLNGVGSKNSTDSTDIRESDQAAATQNQLNAAQQLFRIRYTKPTRKERAKSRARARAHIQGPDQANNALQLSVGRHQAAEVQNNPPSPEHATPTETNQEQQSLGPPQAPQANLENKPQNADSQRQTLCDPQTEKPPTLPESVEARGNITAYTENPKAQEDAIQRGIERPVPRNLGGSWSYASFESAADTTPHLPARFRGLSPAPSPRPSRFGIPSTDSQVRGQFNSLTLPIRTSPNAIPVESGPTKLHASTVDGEDGPEPVTDHSMPKKKRRVRVSMDGSPIFPGSSEDRDTPEISDPPGFKQSHQQSLTSSPMTSQSPVNKPCSNSEYPSPPTVKKNLKYFPDSEVVSSSACETETRRGSLLQALAQCHVKSLGSSKNKPTGMSTSTSQGNLKFGSGAHLFMSNLDPRLFAPLEQTTGNSKSDVSSEPAQNIEVSQRNGPIPTDMEQQSSETQETVVDDTKAGMDYGQQNPATGISGDSMDIDTEEPSQVETSVISEPTQSGQGDTSFDGDTTQSTVSGFGDSGLEESNTSLSDSRIFGPGDTTLEAAATLGASAGVDVKGAADSVKPSKKGGRRSKAGTKTGKSNAESASNPKTEGTARQPTKAVGKSKEKSKEAAARTQPRRIAKNGPEPTRELRSRSTKTK